LERFRTLGNYLVGIAGHKVIIVLNVLEGER